MKLTYFLFLISLIFSAKVLAGEMSVQTLSQGACWYEEGEVLRVASFNDKESLVTTRENIDSQIDELLHSKRMRRDRSNDLALHCGGYGASLVVRSELEGRPVCLWLRFSKGALELRSMGGLEATGKNEVCDGYKWGELIVGLKSIEQKQIFESASFQNIVKSVKVISGTTVKVVLKEEFNGLEISAMEELKKQIDVKYIELNLYQHPVGEAATLK